MFSHAEADENNTNPKCFDIRQKNNHCIKIMEAIRSMHNGKRIMIIGSVQSFLMQKDDKTFN